MIFGTHPGIRVKSFLGGVALLGVCVGMCIWLGMANVATRKFGIWLGIAGLGLLAWGFRVKGGRILSEGLETWSFWAWFFGGYRLIPSNEMKTIVLGEEKGKFVIKVDLHDGSQWVFPERWAAVKDAQFVIDAAVKLYGVDAGLAIRDEKLLAEAAEFTKARRYFAKLMKRSRAGGERLRFSDDDDEALGEVRVLRGLFQRSRAEVYEGAVGAEETSPRWKLEKSWLRQRVAVADGLLETGGVIVGYGFSESTLYLRWTDSNATHWSGVLTSPEQGRDPFTLKLFKGLAEKTAGKRERAESEARQGVPKLVALADGPANDFTLDVSDAEAWPWAGIALGSLWLCARPVTQAMEE